MTSIFHAIREIKSASAPAYKAWATRRANAEKRSAAARLAWTTRRQMAH